MMKTLQSRLRLVVVLVPLVGLAACSSDGNKGATTSIESTTSATSDEGESQPSTTAAESESIPDTTGSTNSAESDTTQVTVPAVVPFDGSMADLIAQQPSLSNINEAIAAWLLDGPGREGVLQNGAGITLFLPNDDGFTDADVALAVSDFDAFTLLLSEHLKVGAVTTDQLGTEVSTAMGNAYAIGDGPTIGGQLIVKADITGTNGVLHIIGGQLIPVVVA